jgi:hypothetical protein
VPDDDAVFILFPDCPLPGCHNVVSDPHEVCGQCLDAFGPYLRPVAPLASPAGQRPAPSAVPAGRVTPAQRDHVAAAAVEWKRNQVCWCCEERRTCRQDPDSSNGWICKQCLEIQ